MRGCDCECGCVGKVGVIVGRAGKRGQGGEFGVGWDGSESWERDVWV
jgi:hypothetical protein